MPPCEPPCDSNARRAQKIEINFLFNAIKCKLNSSQAEPLPSCVCLMIFLKLIFLLLQKADEAGSCRIRKIVANLSSLSGSFENEILRWMRLRIFYRFFIIFSSFIKPINQKNSNYILDNMIA